MDRQGRLLRIVENTATEGFWVDAGYRYVAFGPAHAETMRRRFGAEVAVGRDILGYVENETERAALQGLLDQALGGRTVVEVATIAEGTPGERHVEVTYTPVPGADGAVGGVFVSARDVTVADRVESDLRRRERQLERSQELARMGHWYTSLDEKVVELSDSALRIAGVDPAELDDRTMPAMFDVLRSLVHPDDREQAREIIEARMGLEPRDFEFRIVLPTGEVRHLRVRAEVIVEADGRQGILGVFRDDTEQWRAERELHFGEARLRRAEELGGLGHWSVDPATGQTRWSQGLYEILGHDSAVVSPSSSGFFELVHPDDLKAVLELAEQVDGAPGELEVTHRIVRPDGQVRLIRTQAETQRDETGEALLLFGTALDITELARVEGDLAESRDQLRALFDAMTEGFGLVRAVQDAGGRYVDALIIRANPALERLLGAGPLEGERASAVMPQFMEQHPEILERIGAVLGSGEQDDFDVQSVEGDRWFHARLQASGSSEFTVLLTDVTERVLAEREIESLNRQLGERVRELAAANEDLNDLLYSLAHDLRSPLRAIDGFSLAFAEDHVDAVDQRGAEQIGRVRAAAKRLGVLFDAALRLASVGRADLATSTVDLSALAESVALALRDEHPERETRVVVAEGMAAETDPGLARLVLEQLLGNAWKATASRSPGSIEVGASNVGGERRFFVRDDGVGFDQSYAGKVFGPYQQLSPAARHDGAGVGLSMVRRAVDRLGGRCWAEAEPDLGASFWFTLGSAPPEVASAELPT
jgi:PAS domain S-box-containing protein